PRRAQAALRAPRPAGVAVYGPVRALGAREPRLPHASAHLCGTGPDRARLPLLRRRTAGTARAAAARVPARPHVDEHRDRVGVAGDDADALPGDAAARARLRAAARGNSRPARGGAAAAA